MIRFENMSPEVWQAMCTPMHQILAPSSTPSMGGLYLGSMTAVHDQDLLKEQAITHFVQVHEVPWLPNSKDGNNYYRIDILDSCSTDLRPHLEAACDYIDQALKTGRNVLVHCQQVGILFFPPLPPSPYIPPEGWADPTLAQSTPPHCCHHSLWHAFSSLFDTLLTCHPSISGRLTQSCNRHCIPHTQPRNDFRCCPRTVEAQTCVHQPQRGICQGFEGMGAGMPQAGCCSQVHNVKE